MKVCILDYGSGNVKSVFNMLQTITDEVVVSNKKSELESASHIILPGVGAFGASMQKIKAKIPLELLKIEVFKKKKPFLGICVGMQVLANKGFEFGEHAGLGWIDGQIVKLNSGELPLPHIGWNNISVTGGSGLMANLDANLDFYFVHSFVLKPKDEKNIVATAEYGENFCAVVQKENIYGVQFHPEKSQKAGRLLVENFLSLTS